MRRALLRDCYRLSIRCVQLTRETTCCLFGRNLNVHAHVLTFSAENASFVLYLAFAVDRHLQVTGGQAEVVWVRGTLSVQS